MIVGQLLARLLVGFLASRSQRILNQAHVRETLRLEISNNLGDSLGTVRTCDEQPTPEATAAVHRTARALETGVLLGEPGQRGGLSESSHSK
jgi:hypothetical protein